MDCEQKCCACNCGKEEEKDGFENTKNKLAEEGFVFLGNIYLPSGYIELCDPANEAENIDYMNFLFDECGGGDYPVFVKKDGNGVSELRVIFKQT